MNRRDTLLGLLALSAPHSVFSQPAPKLRRVGILSIGTSTSAAPLVNAFKKGMTELGWREGQNVEYRVAYADSQVERLDALARELVEQKIEAFVVGAPQVARAAQKATSTIPIVMTNVSNAVENKFVASLAKPGGNITGVTSQLEAVLGKMIEIFHEAVPRASRYAILLNESNPTHRAFWSGAQSACAALKLVAIRVVANSPGALPGAVAQIVQEKAQAIVVVADGMYLTERVPLQKLIGATRLPAAYALREHVIEGGLLSYAADLARNYQYSATFVDKILKGAKPGDLPVEQPVKFDLAINLKTAKELGISIPNSVMLRADEVIE